MKIKQEFVFFAVVGLSMFSIVIHTIHEMLPPGSSFFGNASLVCNDILCVMCNILFISDPHMKINYNSTLMSGLLSGTNWIEPFSPLKVPITATALASTSSEVTTTSAISISGSTAAAEVKVAAKDIVADIGGIR